jgi:hypothetical protein
MTAPATTEAPKAKKPAAKKSTSKSGARKSSPKAAPHSKPKPSATPSPKAPATLSTDDPTRDPLFIEWQAGTRIADLVKVHKLTRSECRRRLVKAAGSREAFHALRAKGAGGVSTKAAAMPKQER